MYIVAANEHVFSRLQNCPTVSNGSFKAVGRLFHVDWPATAKLLGPKLTVLVLTPADHLGLRNADCDVLKLPVEEQSLMTSTAEPTGAGIWRRRDTVCSQFVDTQAASEDHHVELMWCCRTSAFSRRDAQQHSGPTGKVEDEKLQHCTGYCCNSPRDW